MVRYFHYHWHYRLVGRIYTSYSLWWACHVAILTQHLLFSNTFQTPILHKPMTVTSQLYECEILTGLIFLSNGLCFLWWCFLCLGFLVGPTAAFSFFEECVWDCDLHCLPAWPLPPTAPSTAYKIQATKFLYKLSRASCIYTKVTKLIIYLMNSFHYTWVGWLCHRSPVSRWFLQK